MKQTNSDKTKIHVYHKKSITIVALQLIEYRMEFQHYSTIKISES